MRKILNLITLTLFVVLFVSCVSNSTRVSSKDRSNKRIARSRYYKRRVAEQQAVQKEEVLEKKSYNRTGSEREGSKLTKIKRIYSAKLGLLVKNSKDAVNYITKIMKDNDGFLESQRTDYISIRVPSKNFNRVVNEILLIGEVLHKTVRSYDVSKRYSAYKKRLEIAKIAKARLLVLLKKVKKVKEKVRIIEEIQRLNKEIERLKNSLNAIDSFVNYSVIEVYLKKPALSRVSRAVSLFKWINQLSPSSYQLKESKEVKIALASGFVVFDNEDYFLARSPRGSFVRSGKVENDPVGDNAFWIKALNSAMKLKNYEQIKSDQLNGFSYSLFRFRQLKPFYYSVILTVQNNFVYVTEIYFANEDEYKKYWNLFEKKILDWKVK